MVKYDQTKLEHSNLEKMVAKSTKLDPDWTQTDPKFDLN